MKNLYIIILLIFLVGCANKSREHSIGNNKSKETYMGYKVLSSPFRIAENKIIYLPITRAGIIPAEDNGFKMQVAGFTVNKSTTNNKAELVWNFSFISENKEKINSIVIEELAPTQTIKRLAEIKNPKIVNGHWIFNLTPIEASQRNTPWIFKDKASIYVFKITISLESGKQIYLTQGAWFSRPILNNYAKQISIIEKG